MANNFVDLFHVGNHNNEKDPHSQYINKKYVTQVGYSASGLPCEIGEILLDKEILFDDATDKPLYDPAKTEMFFMFHLIQDNDTKDLSFSKNIDDIYTIKVKVNKDATNPRIVVNNVTGTTYGTVFVDLVENTTTKLRLKIYAVPQANKVLYATVLKEKLVDLDDTQNKEQLPKVLRFYTGTALTTAETFVNPYYERMTTGKHFRFDTFNSTANAPLYTKINTTANAVLKIVDGTLGSFDRFYLTLGLMKRDVSSLVNVYFYKDTVPVIKAKNTQYLDPLAFSYTLDSATGNFAIYMSVKVSDDYNFVINNHFTTRYNSDLQGIKFLKPLSPTIISNNVYDSTSLTGLTTITAV